MSPFLVVLSSPSGGGKTSIARRLLEVRSDLGYSVSATTRPRREYEQDGRDYFFLDRDAFERRRDAGEFVEWADYGGHLYGTLRSELDRVMESGHHPILDIEIHGARQVREQYPDAVRIFVLPPTGKVLARRLLSRNTEHPGTVRRRLARAGEELAEAMAYDYTLVNEDLTLAVAHAGAIIDAEAFRTSRQRHLAASLARLREEVETELEHLPAS